MFNDSSNAEVLFFFVCSVAFYVSCGTVRITYMYVCAGYVNYESHKPLELGVIIKLDGGGLAQWLASDYGPRCPWFETWPRAVRCGLEQVTFTPRLVLVKPRKLRTYD